MLQLKAFVVCRDIATAKKWSSRSINYENIDIECIIDVISYCALINQVLGSDHKGPVLILHDDIWLPIDFSHRITQLISKLDSEYVNWGICGNVGVRWDGEVTARHIFDPHGGPTPGLTTRVMTSIDGNAILINMSNLVKHDLTRIPDLGGFHCYDVVLSYEVIRKGMVVLVDPAMFVVHTSGGNQGEFDKFSRSAALQEYIGSVFDDFAIDTINGRIVFENKTDYKHIENTEASKLVHLLDAYDNSLALTRINSPISLSIAVRTQFQRMSLLTRLLTTVVKEIHDTGTGISIEVLIVSDTQHETIAKSTEFLRENLPDLEFRIVEATIHENRTSRVNLLFQAFASSAADYIWFIDDDDFLLPGAIKAISRTITKPARSLIVFDCLRFAEKWTSVDGINLISSSRFLDRTFGRDFMNCLSGDNFTPNCGVVYPRKIVHEKLQLAAARMHYYEDYFITLVALSLPEISVEILNAALCGISIRARENTVTEKDRTVWNISHATVLSEINDTPNLCIPLLWQKFNAIPRETMVSSVKVPSINWGRIVEDAIYFNPINLNHGTSLGYVDEMEFKDGSLLVKGWALSNLPNYCVETILVVISDQVVAQFPVIYERTDLPEELYIGTSRLSGFRTHIESHQGWVLDNIPVVLACVNGNFSALKMTDDATKNIAEIIDALHSPVNFEDFDENYYLAINPDVASAVENKIHETGYMHWLHHGFGEGRDYRVKDRLMITKKSIERTRGLLFK